MKGVIVKVERSGDLMDRSIVLRLDVRFTEAMYAAASPLPPLFVALQRAWVEGKPLPVRVGPLRLDTFTDQEVMELQQACAQEIAGRMREAAS